MLTKMADILRPPVVKSDPDLRATFFPSLLGLLLSAALTSLLGLLVSTALIILGV